MPIETLIFNLTKSKLSHENENLNFCVTISITASFIKKINCM